MMKVTAPCKETFITEGTGDIILGGPSGTYLGFASDLVNGDTTPYMAADQANIDLAVDWELGILTYHATSNSVSRTAIRRSTNGNLPVDWGSGTKYIWSMPLDTVEFVPGGRPPDIANLVAALGGDLIVQGIYDARYNVIALDGVSVDKWGDARGDNFGPVLVAAGVTRPMYDVYTQTIRFDGVDDRLVSVSNALYNFGGTTKALAYIGSNPAPGNVANLSAIDAFGIVGNAGLIQAYAGGGLISSTIPTSTTRRLTVISKDIGIVSYIDVPDQARVSANVNASRTEFKVLEIGSLQGTSYTAAVVRAVVILSRAATASDIDILRTWSLRFHGDGTSWNQISREINVAVSVETYAGATLGAKLQAAHDALPASGGVLDCRSMTGAQAFASDVAIIRPGVTILWGSTVITTAGYKLTVSSAAHGFQMIGANPYSFNQAIIPGTGGTFFYHNTGTGPCVVIGDGSALLQGSDIRDLAIHCTDASDNAGVIGLHIKRAKGVNLAALYVVCGATKYNQTCLRFDGAGAADFYNVTTNLIMGGGGKGYHLTGSGVNASNACQFFGGSYSGGASSLGIVIDADGNGNYFYGTDIEGCAVAVALSGNAKNNYFNIRLESNTVDATLASGCTDNWLQGSGLALARVTDSDGSNAILEQNGATSAWTLGRVLKTKASATASAGLRLPHGAAPTSPVNGDMWTTTAGLFIRINGATVGPLS